MEESNGIWREIGEFQGNLKQPEEKSAKEMQQFRQEATNFHVSNALLYRRRKTNELPAMVLVGTEHQSKAMEAAHELSGHHGRKGTLQNVVERYWLTEMCVDVKDWVKTCE